MHAQTDLSGVSGTITDQSGAVVRGASVAVIDEATGAEHKTLTNGSGYYTIPSLSPGHYTIVVQVPSFRVLTSNGNVLDPAVATTANLQLQSGSVNQVVQVAAQETSIQTDSTVLGRVITSKQAELLPLSGRNPITLVLLKAGVTSTSGNVSNSQFSTGLGGLNINGARKRRLRGRGGFGERAGSAGVGIELPTGIRPVCRRPTAHHYAWWYRVFPRHAVRRPTEPGTQRQHLGAQPLHLQLQSGAAEELKSNYVAPFTYNQFGFSVNGPAYIPHVLPKDKVFFLYSEAFVHYPATNTAPVTVPNPAFRTGDFSSVTTHLIDPTRGLRPLGSFFPSQIDTKANEGMSTFHALQTNLTHRFDNGFL
ncbi:MAG: Cna domain protein [Edaphobacter sp.]|nr:Cna domain protein [Edaphobacter sp.]